ncbi:MAG: hypothetical protein GX341_00900 [Firmicutes bacterium]|jgi:hypothetical protein|nr:hypothetical protein [Bacillota bacterium]
MLNGNGKRLKPRAFTMLPLGTVKPRGWLKQQLQIQADGLSGHIDEFWEDLGPDNQWFGGSREGWERGPYYADGLVPLAYLLDDEKLKAKAQKWVEAFIDRQREDGWIGPVQGVLGDRKYPEYDPWPVFIVCKVLTQYQEATGDERVIPAMLKFCRYLLDNLDNRPLKSWAKFRWADFIISVHWLYDRTGEEWLLDLAEKVKSQGYDWHGHFVDFRYQRKQRNIDLETHVVNNAMGIKTPGVWYRQSGEPGDREAVHIGLENLDKFHGQVTGVFTGDEHLSGKNPSQGTELCAVVEYMFSLEQLISIMADSVLADRLERIAFNALPATFSPDMWAHQYDQQVNQVICSVAERDWSNLPDANIFGLEPNFGCCTANMHQGWPKFAANLWMGTPDNGLAAVAYAPSIVTAKVGESGQEVSIIEETEYPFGETLDFTIQSARAVTFPLTFRIPAWAKGATLTLPDGETVALPAQSFQTITREWRPGDQLRLTLPMELETERRYQGSIAILRGPLVYSLKIGENWKHIGGVQPHADWEVYPTTPWNYGLVIDPANPGKSIKVVKKPVGLMPYSPEGAPVELKVTGRLVPEWRLEGNWAGPIPQSPARSKERAEKLTLIPYGCTNLRITEFPLLLE